MYEIELHATYHEGHLEVEDAEWSSLFGYNHQKEPEYIKFAIDSEEAVSQDELYSAMDELMEEKEALIQKGYKDATSGSKVLHYIQAGVGLFIAGTFGLVYWATGDVQTAGIAAGGVALGMGPFDAGVAWAMKDESVKKGQFDSRLKRMEEHRYTIDLNLPELEEELDAETLEELY